MIVAAIAGGASLRLVTQPDHAHFAAELLSLWRADGLPEHPRRDDLLFATREHDNGWRELDSSPAVDPSSRMPFDFLGVPAPMRRDVWSRGTRRYAQARPYAAALIAQHALALLRGVREVAEWAEFLADLETRRGDLLAASGENEAALLEDYAWLDLADRVSLIACGASRNLLAPARRVVHRGGNGTAEEPIVIEIDPFPLAGQTSFRIPSRVVPARAYSGDADFAVTAASARWGELVVAVRNSD